jgi:hypothetical protein
LKAFALAVFALAAELTLSKIDGLWCSLCKWFSDSGAFDNVGDWCSNADCSEEESGNKCELHDEREYVVVS